MYRIVGLRRELTNNETRKENTSMGLINIDLHGTLIDAMHDEWLHREVQKGRSTKDESSI
jgi:hypothetical protein